MRRITTLLLFLIILFSNVVLVRASDLTEEKVYENTENLKNQTFMAQTESELSSTNEVDDNTSEIIASGSCGESATWELDSNYTLSISGTGKMTDYTTDIHGAYEVPWKEYSNIKKIVINPGITRIGNGSFAPCNEVREIEISEGVRYIGEDSFSTCFYLETVDLPDSVITIEEHAFGGCQKLWYINIPDNISYIGEHAFSYCYALKNIYVPNGKIKKFAFEYCKSLTSIYIGSGVTEIGEYVFDYCNAIETIDIDSSNEKFSIENGVLFDSEKKRLIKCASLNPLISYIIPDTVTYIDPYAFQACASLESIEMSGSVTKIGNAAFRDCTGLKSIILSANIKI